ncbi:MAG: hypothetical protein F6K65_12875 [Moorea sp. SIO3C2]|nr:hypothetical protein [Moorena sp. SIO3C2]
MLGLYICVAGTIGWSGQGGNPNRGSKPSTLAFVPRVRVQPSTILILRAKKSQARDHYIVVGNSLE